MRAGVLRAVLVAAAVLPSGAGAQTLSLTESQVLAQLSPDSPWVQAARAPVDVARAEVLAAGRWPNPRATFNREAVAGVTENMVMVAQLLPVSGRRDLEVRAASARVDAVSSRADEQVRRARADVRLAFADLVAAQSREQELTRARDRLRGLATLLSRREAAGDAAGFDRLRAEREVLELDADLAAAAIDRARAQGGLALFLSEPVDASRLEAVASPAATGDAERSSVPSLDELIAHAEMSRGDLIALQRDAEAAALTGRAAGRRSVPEPEVVAGTKSSSAGSGDVGGIFSVHVTVPLFDRARPERTAAEARQRQARAEAEVLRRTLRTEIAAWRSAVVERRDIADRYQTAMSTNADRIERIAQVSYEAGERGILELLDAHRVASAARLRQVSLDAAVRAAEIELEYVSGSEIP
jgi:cobalt-zinc-cadmium efflux system outer membrane protein